MGIKTWYLSYMGSIGEVSDCEGVRLSGLCCLPIDDIADWYVVLMQFDGVN